MAEDYSYEDKLAGQQMTKEERYAQIIDYMNDVHDFDYHNGIKLTELTDGYCSCRVEMTPETQNSQGFAHGGIVFSILDVAAGFAAAFIDRRCVTQAASVNFLRPAVGAYLVAKAEPIKVGRTVAVVDSRVYDDQERLVAIATFSIYYT